MEKKTHNTSITPEDEDEAVQSLLIDYNNHV